MKRNRATVFGVIGAFVTKEFNRICLADGPFRGILRRAVQRSGHELVLFPTQKENTDHGFDFIPLVLCDNRESLKRKGILCPYEFVIERRDLLPAVDNKGNILSNPEAALALRITTLAMIYGESPDFREALQDWFAGAFRLYLMLDSTTHGTSQYIDLELVKKREDKILCAASEMDSHYKLPDPPSVEQVLAFRLMKRFCGDVGAEERDYQRLAKIIYKTHFNKLAKIFNCKTDKTARLEQLVGFYEDEEMRLSGSSRVPLSHSDRLPLAFGERAKYVTPSGKLNLLLIDDNVQDSPLAHLEEEDVPSCFKDMISCDDWSLMRAIFNVQTMPVDKDAGDIYVSAARRMRKMQKWGMTYDLILVDLCLGNQVRGADLDGYAMIRIARIFFPGTPIVVYSRFNDMEHVARAFFNGAKWFLVKGEEAKLPRHVLKLLKQVGWHREWRSVQNSSYRPDFRFEKLDDFANKFKRTEEWKYLTYKSLEYFQGNCITVRKMGGGISSAVTFKATKGIKLGEEFLQTPSIIKIDTSYNTGMEFERYFRMIRPYIANEAGRVEMPERVLNRNYASIVYTFAGKQDKAHDLSSMGDMLDDDVASKSACDFETYRYALTCIFDEILPKIHRVAPELEIGDVAKPCVVKSDVKDAFEWMEDEGRKTSFPNLYFGEFAPSDFWKGYMLRMQPWARVTVCRGMDGKLKSMPFSKQKVVDISDGASEPEGHLGKKVTFHNIMSDPFCSRGEKSKRPGGEHRIIEAYDANRRLIWLDGDGCDFVARFRKRISPGASLWLYDEDWISENGVLKTDVEDYRVTWLQQIFMYKGTDYPDAENVFRDSLAKLIAPKVSLASGWKFYTTIQDELFAIAKAAKENAAKWKMKCPVGIVHGDLNVKNIMLESRVHAPKAEDLDVTKAVSDVWLIDFARTRRDLISHDFNVFFTSVLGELFTEGLVGKNGKQDARQSTYWGDMTDKFGEIVAEAVKPQSKSKKGVPDTIKDDQRLVLIYRILRRTHDAAVDAGVSQNMYLLTTSLACLYTLKIFLNNGCKVRLAAGYFAAAWICYDLLCEALDIENKMKRFKIVKTPRSIRSSKAKVEPENNAIMSASVPAKPGKREVANGESGHGKKDKVPKLNSRGK